MANPFDFRGRPAFAALVAAALACAVPPAQAQLPGLNSGGDMTPGAERRLGNQIARDLFRDPDHLEDPVLAEYVQGIWQGLLAGARRNGELDDELAERFAWQVLLRRDRSINAFALPGGYFGLHLGLIGAVTSPDELASVLAHELTHVTQRHIQRLMTQQERQSPWLLGAMILGALAASKNPEAANALIVGGQAVAVQNQLNFSRDMEREADRIGLSVLRQAGFDPHGALGLFEKLQQASRLTDNGAFPYLRSHPLTTERIADMRARLQPESAPAARAPDLAHAQLAARARVLANPGVDVLRAWVGEASADGFQNLPPDRQAAVLYAGTLASAQWRDFTTARALLTRLQARVAGHAAAERQATLLAAELAVRAGAFAEAERLLQPLDPRARPVLLLRAQARLGSAQPAALAESAGTLQDWLATHPADAPAWQLLADLQTAQGQPLRAIRSLAEAQVARQDLAGALDRFKAGQAAVRPQATADEAIDAAILDARRRETETQWREQQDRPDAR
jgi:predicted Zn-dependent protease